MYKCKYFQLDELLPEKLYKELKNLGRLEVGWLLFDDRLLKTLDKLRETFGAITVNDWKWGGHNHYRGFRPDNCQIGSKYSQHRFGRACDCIFKNYSASEVRERVLANPELFPAIKGLEMDVSWFHFDLRNSVSLVTFRP